jgi:hypothetical protein
MHTCKCATHTLAILQQHTHTHTCNLQQHTHTSNTHTPHICTLSHTNTCTHATHTQRTQHAHTHTTHTHTHTTPHTQHHTNTGVWFSAGCSPSRMCCYLQRPHSVYREHILSCTLLFYLTHRLVVSGGWYPFSPRSSSTLASPPSCAGARRVKREWARVRGGARCLGGGRSVLWRRSRCVCVCVCFCVVKSAWPWRVVYG